MRSLLVNELLKKAIYIDCKNKSAYVDNKPSDKLESTNIIAMSKDGEFQIVLPPDTRKCEEFQSKFSFGDKIDIEELFDVNDIKVSIYKDNLLVKVLADYKED